MVIVGESILFGTNVLTRAALFYLALESLCSYRLSSIYLSVVCMSWMAFGGVLSDAGCANKH